MMDTYREDHEPFCRWTRPAHLVQKDGNNGGDHAQERARDGDKNTNLRNTVQPREGHECHRGAQNDGRLKRGSS